MVTVGLAQQLSVTSGGRMDDPQGIV